ncbi:MAG: fluoride efflux transporter CrcB [Crocinitomicaceae bacterium]|nr:fluoride efflux transporter CrcB [Crocinitomicaceae bacterium]
MKAILLVGLGGGVGSIFRYLTSLLVIQKNSTSFPLATFIVNTAGCLLIGLFIGFLEKSQVVNNDLKLLLVTGFCGGFTTFSTFANENIFLFQSGNYLTAISYTLLSLIIGILFVFIGLYITKP